MSQWPVIAILWPLIVGFSLLLMRPLGLAWVRSLSLLSGAGLLVLSVYLLHLTASSAPLVYLAGNWVAPFGIVYVLDGLSALMLVLTSGLALLAMSYAILQGVDKQGAHFHVLFSLQIFGLNGAFLTGDVFNLFVFFEVLLLASYGLMLHGGGRERTKAGLHYLVVNLVGSTLFLFAVGALYGVLGTLNLADMAMKIGQLSPADQPIVLAAGLLLLVVFGIKAAAFPLYLWMPQTYANTSAPVAVLFAIMTKVGLYAILRVHGQLFGEQAGALAGVHWPYVFWAGIVTLILASLGVLAARGVREQAAYLVLASVALIMAAMALNQPQTLAAALYYWVHSTLLAGGFFLLADLIARGRGAWADRFEIGPVMPRAVVLGSLFFAYAVALTGLPPLSGFIGKAWIIQSALVHAQGMTLMLVVLVTSLLMVVAMARAGSLLFYKAQALPEGYPMEGCRVCQQGGLALVALVFSLLWVVFAGPASGLMESIAVQTYDWQSYQASVLGQSPIGGVQ